MRVILKQNFATPLRRFKRAENADGTTTIPEEWRDKLPSTAQIVAASSVDEATQELQTQMAELQEKINDIPNNLVDADVDRANAESVPSDNVLVEEAEKLAAREEAALDAKASIDKEDRLAQAKAEARRATATGEFVDKVDGKTYKTERALKAGITRRKNKAKKK